MIIPFRLMALVALTTFSAPILAAASVSAPVYECRVIGDGTNDCFKYKSNSIQRKLPELGKKGSEIQLSTRSAHAGDSEAEAKLVEILVLDGQNFVVAHTIVEGGSRFFQVGFPSGRMVCQLDGLPKLLDAGAENKKPACETMPSMFEK